MKILLLCLKAFEMMEASPFVDVFGWARDDFECDIEVVTCGYQRKVVSTFGISIEVDKLIDDIDVNEYSALAISGGFQEYGFYDEAYHKKTLDLIQLFYQAHKPIASVCVAAFPLAKSGVLNGKKATTYHLRGGYKRDKLENFGVILGERWLEVDDFIIRDKISALANAEEKGEKKKTIEIAKNLLDILDDETIAIKTGLSIEEVKVLRKEYRGVFLYS